jgi:hypothetical protein
VSQEHSKHSVVEPFIADGVISKGHAVTITATGHVAQCSIANTMDGGYVGPDDAAQYDHVEVCTAGLCLAWLDGAITVNPTQAVANDSDGHIVADTTDKHRIGGFARESNGATENFGEIFINLGFNAA